MQLHNIIETIAPTVFRELGRAHYQLVVVTRSDIDQLFIATLTDLSNGTHTDIRWSYLEDTTGTERQKIELATQLLKHGSEVLDNNMRYRNPAPVPIHPYVDEEYQVQDVDFSE